MHADARSRPSGTDHGGEKDKGDNTVTSTCTQICGIPPVLVHVFPEGSPEQSLKTYAIMDNQSNRSLASSKFFDHFSEHGDQLEYTLS